MNEEKTEELYEEHEKTWAFWQVPVFPFLLMPFDEEWLQQRDFLLFLHKLGRHPEMVQVIQKMLMEENLQPLQLINRLLSIWEKNRGTKND